jgi:hypothetical protein
MPLTDSFNTGCPYFYYGLTLLNIERKGSDINLYFNVSDCQDTVTIKDQRWYHTANASLMSREEIY